MPWPSSQDYNEAVQSPEACFADPELRGSKAAVNALGLPLPCSGNFADVYRLTCPATGRSWAVKCFTRQVPALRERYQQIGLHLAQVRLPFMVEFTFLDRGIRVRGDCGIRPSRCSGSRACCSTSSSGSTWTSPRR
jgi:hypothetical protein